jgi:hypothetical protein
MTFFTKKYYSVLMLLLPCFVLTTSCSDNDEKTPAEYHSQDISNCHHNTTWDAQSVKSRIIGIWEWKYIICCGETSKPYENGFEANGVIIEFKTDGTGELSNKGSKENFVWDISKIDNDLFKFETTPVISRLHGQLLFCDNIMLCNGFPVDGADNFFKKIVLSQ